MWARLRCLVRGHRWQRRENREAGGPDAVYFVCTRCGRDKPEYGPQSTPIIQ